MTIILKQLDMSSEHPFDVLLPIDRFDSYLIGVNSYSGYGSFERFIQNGDNCTLPKPKKKSR